MWVRSEYAGELAVLSAWLCALLPWGITYTAGGGARLVRMHFIYGFLQFTSGLGGVAAPYVLVYDAPGFPGEGGVAFGYQLWLVTAIVFSGAIVLSVLYYVYDERLESRSPVDPVRLMGGLLVLSAIGLSAATYVLVTHAAGWTIPIGVPFLYVLGGLLLVVERTDVDPEEGSISADIE